MPQDLSLSAEWYRKAAEQGHTAAQSALGNLYLAGEGVSQDYALALHWLQKAAQKEDDVAQYWLGKMHSEGLGVPVDLERAFHLFECAAKEGFAEAQYEVGEAYCEGRGVSNSNAHAIEWFRAGAEQGDARCQGRLGMMYARGIGVTQDDLAAQEWLNKSAAQGFPGSLLLLDVLYPDEINGPRVPAEMVPEVEELIKLKKMIVWSGPNRVGEIHAAGACGLERTRPTPRMLVRSAALAVLQLMQSCLASRDFPRRGLGRIG